MARGKSRQISFREKEDLAAKVLEAAKVEDLDLADFVRKIFRFAFKEYQTAGSLYALRVRVEAAEGAKNQIAIEDELRRKKPPGGIKKNRKAS
jgi:hypothetical protein